MLPQIGSEFKVRSRAQREERATQIVLKLLRGLEALLGFLSVLSIMVFAITDSIVIFGKTLDTAGVLTFIAMFLAILLPGLIVESVLLCALSDKLRLGWKPLPLMFALHMRRWPMILRPVVGVWWTAHFLLGMVIALKIEMGLASAASEYGIQMQIVIFLAISFSLAFAFNLYAMLALAAFGFREQFIRSAWKWRVTIDFVIAIAALVLPMERYEYNSNFLFLYRHLLVLRHWLRDF